MIDVDSLTDKEVRGWLGGDRVEVGVGSYLMLSSLFSLFNLEVCAT